MSSIERRAYLRYKISIPVRLENGEGVLYETITKDLSLGGMQVECSGLMLHRLLPSGINTSRAEQIELKAHLQTENKDNPLVLNTIVQGVLRLAESTYSIRLLIADLDSEQKSHLSKLLKD